MSNTAQATPYAATTTATTTATGPSFFDVTEDDLAASVAHQATVQRERLQCCHRVDLVSSDTTGILQAARQLGYAQVPLMNTQPGHERRIELRGSSGERVLVELHHNRVSLLGNRSQQDLEAIVKQRTVDAVTRHLSSIAGNQITTHERNGVLEFIATEATGKADGRATITAVVDAKGAVALDIEGLRGARCESLLDATVHAMGARVTQKKLKPAYFSSNAVTAKRDKIKG